MLKRSILVFGVGSLQKSIIQQCKKLGLFTVGLDISPDAECKELVDAFEVAAGNDFDTTLRIAKKYQVKGVITAATDKPLVMMARVAERLSLPFYSIQTALWSTDKQLMKQRFIEYGVPCAKGMEIRNTEELDSIPWNYPVIVKPRDNSGSRGVIYCTSREEAAKAIKEAFEYTHKESILVEEYIEGQEYSIESMHYRGETHVVQFTQKITTEFPYNVELGHIQPAELSDKKKEDIRSIVGQIAISLGFDNCASHTELKINKNGVVVIETSPRLGGDFITSTLTPLSTGVNLEELLVKMSMCDRISEDSFKAKQQKSSGVLFFHLPKGRITDIDNLGRLEGINGYQKSKFNKAIGDEIPQITNSIDRYGYVIFQTDDKDMTKSSMEEAKSMIREIVRIGS